jgi:hypothetical protein
LDESEKLIDRYDREEVDVFRNLKNETYNYVQKDEDMKTKYAVQFEKLVEFPMKPTASQVVK